MDAIDSGDESDDEPMSTDMLEDIPVRSYSHPNINRREVRYKIHDRIKQIQSEWKRALKDTQTIGKVLHKLFKTVAKYISKSLPPLGYLVQKFPISFQNP